MYVYISLSISADSKKTLFHHWTIVTEIICGCLYKSINFCWLKKSLFCHWTFITQIIYGCLYKSIHLCWLKKSMFHHWTFVTQIIYGCPLGWVNFSEFEITECGSCKMSTTKKWQFFIFLNFIVLWKPLLIFPPPYIVKKIIHFHKCLKTV